MNLKFDTSVIQGYHSGTQIARMLTESWVGNNMYCPRCGNTRIQKYENNRPVADFFCPVCNSQFELKSKSGNFGSKINDGAYSTMIQRITSNSNPDFFIMSYSKFDYQVNDLFLIPKYFFTPDVIEKRTPLSPTARRAGWTGCNIVLDKIPVQGRICIIKNGIVEENSTVLQKVRRGSRFEESDIDRRGWLFDILNCVNSIPFDTFELDEVYRWESILQKKHPNNNNIRPKIRQQLQVLRDMGFLLFLGNGKYKKNEG